MKSEIGIGGGDEEGGTGCSNSCMCLDLDSLEYDVVCLGTGLTESVISAAVARAGHSVIHLDISSNYGGTESTVSPSFFCKPRKYEPRFPLENRHWNDNDLEGQFFSPHCQQVGPNAISSRGLNTLSDEYCNNISTRIDLHFRVAWNRSKIVDLLIRSSTGNYLEFMPINRIHFLKDGELIGVPIKKSDVFANKSITLVEKRMLMRFMAEIGQAELFDECYQNMSFRDFLLSKNLSETVRNVILYAILLESGGPGEVGGLTVKDGIKRVNEFLRAVDHFQDRHSPWIYPLYGIGDISQAFVRLGAIYGAIHILSLAPSHIKINENHILVQITPTQTLKCKRLVSNFENANCFINGHTRIVDVWLRAVLVVDGPILNGTTEWIVLAPNSFQHDQTIFAIQLNHSARVSPENKHLIHLVTKKSGKDQTAENVLKPIVNYFTSSDHDEKQRPMPTSTNTQKPKLNCVIYYEQLINDIDPNWNVPNNVFLIPDPNSLFDLDERIDLSKKIFKQMYPEEEFLHPVPNPEDVIWETENENKI